MNGMDAAAKDTIQVGDRSLDLESFDRYFELATEEGERARYEERQKVLAVMKLNSWEKITFDKLFDLTREARESARIDTIRQKKMAELSSEIALHCSEERYWQYVYARQSETYILALQDAGVDLDDVNAYYEDNGLVRMFLDAFVVMENYRINTLPVGLS